MIALVAAAAAETVAVLDFDGYGVPFDEAQVVTEGVRAAFLASGTLDPLSGPDTADGVSRGLDETLRGARERVARARALEAGGAADAARPLLEEALRLHTTAWSDIGRRSELADAWVLLGLCAVDRGALPDARKAFAEAVRLVPAYAVTRGARLPTEAAELLAAEEAEFAAGPRRVRPAAEVAQIAERLEVDHVVTGWVTADGEVDARLYAGGALVAQAREPLAAWPPAPGDDAYAALVDTLLAARARVAEAAPEPEAPPPRVAVALAEPARPTYEVTPAPAARRPVTARWWFWTGSVALLGGGAFWTWYAFTPPPVEYVTPPDGWSVAVELPQ